MGFEKRLETELSQLQEDEQKAIKAAMKAVDSAYAPQSNYHVGAALLLENGEIIMGSNQENVAYPSGMCAERSALFAYGSNNRDLKIKILAIMARDKKGVFSDNCSPCGSCRQVMVEYERLQKTPYKVIFCYNGTFEIASSSSDLMPFPFHF